MAIKRGKDADVVVDLHGLTVEQARHTLQQRWPEWRGMRSIRVVHGRGASLKPEVQRWCHERGIPCELDDGNPGSIRMFPSRRSLPEPTVSTTLAEKGLRLTPDELAYLRDPGVVERAREDARRHKREADRLQVQNAGSQALEKRKDELLWLAEISRLDRIDGKLRPILDDGMKPTPPCIVPPADIKHQEGYWRSELVRVADTDLDTLRKQKRTGLDKLAPPMEAAKAGAAAGSSIESHVERPGPQRDTSADSALFEDEIARLSTTDSSAKRRR